MLKDQIICEILETKTYAESSSNYFQGVDSGEEFILEEIYQDMIEQEIKNNEKNTEQNQNELLQHSRYEKLEDEMKNEVNESIEDSLLIQDEFVDEFEDDSLLESIQNSIHPLLLDLQSSQESSVDTINSDQNLLITTKSVESLEDSEEEVKKGRRKHPNLKKTKTRIDVRCKVISRALVYILKQRFLFIKDYKSDEEKILQLKIELERYYDIEEDKDKFIQVFFLLLRKILNKTSILKINKRSPTFKELGLNEANVRNKIVEAEEFIKMSEKSSNAAKRSFVTSHPIMKLGKNITLNENDGANLEIFWRRIFSKKTKDCKDEYNGDCDSEKEYKKLIMEDLENF